MMSNEQRSTILDRIESELASMEDKTRSDAELSVLYKVSKALVHRQAVAGLTDSSPTR